MTQRSEIVPEYMPLNDKSLSSMSRFCVVQMFRNANINAFMAMQAEGIDGPRTVEANQHAEAIGLYLARTAEKR